MPLSVAERLRRVHEAEVEGLAAETSGRRARLWAVCVPLVFVGAVLVAAAGAYLLRPAPGPAPGPRTPSLAEVSAEAGLKPHVLYGTKLQTAIYRPASATKPLPTGTPGVVLLYTVDFQNVEVYELVDPSPATPIAVDPQTQAPADLRQIAGHPTLTWLTPNRDGITQLAFKTSDGLLIYVQANSSITSSTAVWLVSQLSGASS